ncbi:DMT family transporter [Paractinoplanes ferrugineus]|uniref:DMT family transporter n=1 Tax=Paractinoplanes ferrugineus TaxID=113564 RepID=UPI001EF26BA5|nr:DMT family transporter [Actinoplanes ferrugineus]
MSAASYATAAVAQERLAKNGHRGPARWAVALLLTAAGVGLHVIALNFGTVAIVQALGTLTLLFALPISALRYRTPISIPAWIDAGLTVLGLALIMSLSVDSAEPSVLTTADSRYVALLTVVVVVALVVAATTAKPRIRAMLLAGAAGVAFGISSVLSKSVMTSFTAGGVAALPMLLTAMVVLLSTAGYLLSQFSYRGAGLAAPLATVSVSNPIVAAIAGVVVFGESFRFGTAGRVVVAVAAIVMTLGVIGLARRTSGPAEPEADDVQESTTLREARH